MVPPFNESPECHIPQRFNVTELQIVKQYSGLSVMSKQSRVRFEAKSGVPGAIRTLDPLLRSYRIADSCLAAGENARFNSVLLPNVNP